MTPLPAPELPANIPLKTALGLTTSSIIIFFANTRADAHQREFLTLTAPSAGALVVLVLDFICKRIWFARGNKALAKRIVKHQEHIKTLVNQSQEAEKALYEAQLTDFVKLLHDRTMKDLTS